MVLVKFSVAEKLLKMPPPLPAGPAVLPLMVVLTSVALAPICVDNGQRAAVKDATSDGRTASGRRVAVDRALDDGYRAQVFDAAANRRDLSVPVCDRQHTERSGVACLDYEDWSYAASVHDRGVERVALNRHVLGDEDVST
jgi:hypothetical protein